MKKIIYVIIFTALLFTACKNGTKNSDTEVIQKKEVINKDKNNDSSSFNEEGDQKAASEISVPKNTATTEIIDGYLQLKNALVATDSGKAAEAGKVILTAFSNFDMTTLSDSQHKEYMEIAENAIEQAEHIVKSHIEHQREHFEVLSNDINDLIALLGTDKTLYQDFCPMYNKNKGGIWISETKEISNPYFGNKMLKCGRIQKQFN